MKRYKIVNILLLSFLFSLNVSASNASGAWLDESRIHAHMRVTTVRMDEPGFYMIGARADDLNIKVLTRHVKSGEEAPWWEWDAFSKVPPVETGFTSNDTVEIVQDMFQEPAAYGVMAAAYYWLGSDDGALAEHPEWTNLDVQGVPQTHDNKGNLVDIANRGYQDLVVNRLKTLASYGAKGVYFDHRHGNTAGCFGSRVEELYTGTIPSSMDLSDPDYTGYLQFNATQTANAIARIKNLVQASYPDFRFIVSCTEWTALAHPLMSGRIAQIADVPKMEFRLPVLQGLLPEVVADELEANGAYAPISTRLSYSYNLARTTSRSMPHVWGREFMSLDQHRAFVVGVIANGGIANMDLDDQFMLGNATTCWGMTEQDVRALFAMGNRISEPLQGMQPKAYTAVYFSERLRDTYSTNYVAAWQEVVMPPQLVYRELMKQAVPVDVLGDFNVRDDDLSVYDSIFVTQRSSLAANYRSKLDAYEAAGGTVYEITNANPRALGSATLADIQTVIAASPIRLNSSNQVISATTFNTSSGDRQCFYISNDLSWIQEAIGDDIRQFNDVGVEVVPSGIHSAPANISGLTLKVSSSQLPSSVWNHYSNSAVSYTPVTGGFEIDIPAFKYGSCLEIVY